MTRYFAQNTPRAGLEHMMMSVPGFQKRGGGMMILSRFCYKPEDVDCRYCLHYRRRSCQVRTCPYIAERLKSGAIEYLDLILEYFGHIPHAGLHKRIQAVEHWSGPDQAVLHTVSVHLRSRFADRVWDDAPPGYLAALYLLASKERLWQPALPALSHDSIDFSRIVSKPHGFAIQDYIDVCVLVLCAMLVIALAVQVLPAFIAKQQLDTFATELVREAEIAGRIGPETDRREQALREQTGLDPEIEWSDTGRIQLNEEVTVTLTHEIDLGLFAGFGSFPITLRADATGKSEVYWK